MLTIPTSVRIFLFTQPCDMRKGFNGLCALVRAYGEDVFSGHLFVFISRRRDRVKILTWSSGGFVLYYKRLEKGRFRPGLSLEGEETLQLEPSQLTMLLEGIDYSRIRKPRHWTPPNNRK